MKVLKKFTSALCLTLCMVLAIGGTSASAATWRKVTVNSSSAYNNEWEKTITYKATNDAGNKFEIGIMVYGYDKGFINEDYVWTKAYECSSMAELQRISVDANLKYDEETSRNKWSKLEVKHKNFHIMYQIKFWSTYNGVTGDTPVDSNEK